jgi:TonB family protein
MADHADILDTRESLSRPLLGSALFHAAVFGSFVLLSTQFARNREVWGVPNPAGGGAVAINPVSSIPLPRRRGPVNPVANDTESVVPQAPKQEVRKTVKAPEPDAIPLRRNQREKVVREQTSPQRYHPPTPAPANQIYNTQAPAAVSPMYNKPGTGAVGIGDNSAFGNRFGAYAALVTKRVAERWQTSGLTGVRAPIVVVTFDLLRDGTIRNPQLVQRSGVTTLDYSALRAVNEAAPFPPLPAEFDRSVVNVELRFQLQP